MDSEPLDSWLQIISTYFKTKLAMMEATKLQFVVYQLEHSQAWWQPKAEYVELYVELHE